MSSASAAGGCTFDVVSLVVGGKGIDKVVKLARATRASETALEAATRGAIDAPRSVTVAGERFVRVAKDAERLNFTFETPGGLAPRTFAIPEDVFKAIGTDPGTLKNVLDLPGQPPAVYRVLEPPPGTAIQRGIVPGGQFGGAGGRPEVFFPEGF